MLPAEIIRKKRDGKELSSQEIAEFIGGYVSGTITDYQASAMCMAIFFQGLVPRETADLTRAMIKSGITYSLPDDRPLVDKHSTGGVGDKVSLILAPLAAACGLSDPMVAGRGLGHTGGTLDKLESIPGFSVNLTADEFAKQVAELGVAMIGQSEDLVPADKKLYSLRDVTGTVESIPLIVASILSKKAASGVRAIIMDVKCGTGAFMSNLEDARKLGTALIETGKALDLPVRCIISNMNQPLGNAVGNALEVRESIDCLNGGGPDDLREIVIELVAQMCLLGKLDSDHAAAIKRATAHLDDGSALKIFREMISRQGGNISVIDQPEKLDGDCQRTEYIAESDGFFEVKDCRAIGLAALALGAGRRKITDKIDPAVGLLVHKKTGDKVSANEPLVSIFYRNDTTLEDCRHHLKTAVNVTENPPETTPLIIERML